MFRHVYVKIGRQNDALLVMSHLALLSRPEPDWVGLVGPDGSAIQFPLSAGMQRSGSYLEFRSSIWPHPKIRIGRTQTTKRVTIPLGPIRVSRTLDILADAFSLADITNATMLQIRSRFMHNVAATWVSGVSGITCNPASRRDMIVMLTQLFVGQPGVYEDRIFGADLISGAATITNREPSGQPVVLVDNAYRMRIFIRRLAEIISRQPAA